MIIYQFIKEKYQNVFGSSFSNVTICCVSQQNKTFKDITLDFWKFWFAFFNYQLKLSDKCNGVKSKYLPLKGSGIEAEK